MNKLLKASIGGVVRAGLVYLGAKGYLDSTGIAPDDFVDALNTIIDGSLIVFPVLWSIWHKVKVANVIADAKAGLL